MNDFKIIGSNFGNQEYKIKVAKSLLIREKRSSLKMLEITTPLTLFKLKFGEAAEKT